MPISLKSDQRYFFADSEGELVYRCEEIWRRFPGLTLILVPWGGRSADEVVVTNDIEASEKGFPLFEKSTGGRRVHIIVAQAPYPKSHR